MSLTIARRLPFVVCYVLLCLDVRCGLLFLCFIGMVCGCCGFVLFVVVCCLLLFVVCCWCRLLRVVYCALLFALVCCLLLKV